MASGHARLYSHAGVVPGRSGEATHHGQVSRWVLRDVVAAGGDNAQHLLEATIAAYPTFVQLAKDYGWSQG